MKKDTILNFKVRARVLVENSTNFSEKMGEIKRDCDFYW